MAKKTQRADGRYQKTIIVGRKADGTYIRKSVYGRTQKELNEKVTQIQHDVNTGVFVKDDRVTFGEMTKLWIENYKPDIAERTREQYRIMLDTHLLPSLGGYFLKELKPLHLQTILNDLSVKGYAMCTMKKAKQTACQILEAAMENDLLHRNVFKQVKVPFKAPAERRALTDEEIALLTRSQRHRMSLAALIMLYCGLRRGEMLALNWEDIDLDAQVLHVNKAIAFVHNQPELKTPKPAAGVRDVPIPELLLPLMRAQQSTGLVFKALKGGLMTDTAFARAWDSYMNYLNVEAGGTMGTPQHPRKQVLEHITPHMLRHTYASLLYSAGVDVKSAQRFLGHASLEMTLGVYTHLSKYKEDQSIDALNAFLKKE